MYLKNNNLVHVYSPFCVRLTVCVVFTVMLLNASKYSAWAAEDEDGFYTYAKDEYPNPLNEKDAANCGRKEPSRFCNAQRSAITVKQAYRIDEILREIANGSGCICEHGCPVDENGLIVGVALLKSAEKSSYEYLQEYADYLRKKWRLGSCENGVLIFIVVKKGLVTVSMGDKASIALGNGLFDQINARESSHIRNESELFNALERLLQSYYEKIQSLNLTKESAIRWTPNVILIVAIVFGALCLLICLIGTVYHISTTKCRRRRIKVNTSEHQSSTTPNNCCYCCFEAVCCCL